MSKANKNDQNVIEVKPVDTSKITKELPRFEKLMEIAKSFTIKTQAEYLKAAALLTDVKAKYKETEQARKVITVPIDAAKKAVQLLFSRPKEVLEISETLLKKAMITYTDEQEKIRLKKQAKLDKQAEVDRKKKEDQQRAWEKKEQDKKDEADRLEAEGKAEEAQKARDAAEKAADKAEERSMEADNVIAAVVAPKVHRVSTVSYREDWYAEVVDFSALPDTYKLPDLPKLNKMAKAIKNTVPVPGVVFKSKRVLASK